MSQFWIIRVIRLDSSFDQDLKRHARKSVQQRSDEI